MIFDKEKTSKELSERMDRIRSFTQKKQFVEAYGLFMKRMVKERMEAEMYPVSDGVGREELYQNHMKEIKVAFENKFHEDIWPYYEESEFYGNSKAVQFKTISQNVKLFLGVLFSVFIFWLVFGGLFEEKSTSNSVYIDCQRPGMESNRYCNGDAQGDAQEQSFREDSYYQNMRGY